MSTPTRRSINLDTQTYEELSFKKSEVQLIMKKAGVKNILSKTSMTKVLEATIKNTPAATLAELLK
jgi:hypothetical protein